MSVTLNSALDPARRAACEANDLAVAAGTPIGVIASSTHIPKRCPRLMLRRVKQALVTLTVAFTVAAAFAAGYSAGQDSVPRAPVIINIPPL